MGDARMFSELTHPSTHKLTVLDSAVSNVLVTEDGPVITQLLALRVKHTELEQPFNLLFKLPLHRARRLHQQLTDHLAAAGPPEE
jgi:hypothetical protein